MRKAVVYIVLSLLVVSILGNGQGSLRENGNYEMASKIEKSQKGSKDEKLPEQTSLRSFGIELASPTIIPTLPKLFIYLFTVEAGFLVNFTLFEPAPALYQFFIFKDLVHHSIPKNAP